MLEPMEKPGFSIENGIRKPLDIQRMTALVQVSGLAKTFDVSPPWLNRVLERKPRLFVHAVDGVSFTIEKGERVGFLGPNGAGKTTTIRMIAGLLKPTSGRIVVNGHDTATSPEGAKASLGFIPDRPFVYEKLTAGEFLRFHAGLYGLDGAPVTARAASSATRWQQRRAARTC